MQKIVKNGQNRDFEGVEKQAFLLSAGLKLFLRVTPRLGRPHVNFQPDSLFRRHQTRPLKTLKNGFIGIGPGFFQKIDFSIFDLLPATNSEKRFTGPQQALSSPLSTLKLPNSKLLFRAVLRAIQSEALEIWLVRYWALESRENQSVEETFQNLFFALFRAYQGLETGWKCYRLILGCVWQLGQKSSKIDHI